MATHQIKPVDGDLADDLNRAFARDKRDAFIVIDGCTLPEPYKNFADAIENFEVRDDDVWLCSFPKTGTTWTQEMVWSIATDLDFERGKVCLEERFPCLEISAVVNMVTNRQGDSAKLEPVDYIANSISYVASMPSPRFIKTHLPANLLPRQLRTGEKKPKVVYVCRNPKDTCISSYHFFKWAIGYEGTFEEYCSLFLGGRVYYGSFWKHVLGYWNKRNDFNMLLLKYEDMKKDLSLVIKKAEVFLGKNLTNDQVSLLSEHLSFSSMKANPAVNHEAGVSRIRLILQVDSDGAFLRKGTSGQWKTGMTPEVIKQFDDCTQKHFEGTGLSL